MASRWNDTSSSTAPSNPRARTCFRCSSAFGTASSIRRQASSGWSDSAARAPSAALTMTVVTPSIASFASFATVSSPATSTTGTPRCPARAALRPISPRDLPSQRTSAIAAPEMVWESTEISVPTLPW
jgi:hypothetical protein